MQVTVLGSGGAALTPRRASSGFLVEWSGGALILDASTGTYGRALQFGLSHERLSAVAISHFHLDHIGDLPGMFWARSRWPELDRPILIASPPGLAEVLPPLRGAHRFESYPFEVDGLRIEAFPAAHTPEAVCLRLSADGVVLAYSGDTEDCPGLRAACADADLALLEASSETPSPRHLSADQAAAIARECGVKRFLLIHLGPFIETIHPAAEDGQVVPISPR